MVAYQHPLRQQVVPHPPWGARVVTHAPGVSVVGVSEAMDPWEFNKVLRRWAQTWIQDLYNPHLEDCSKFSLEFLKKRLYFYILPNSVYYWQQHETKKRNHFLTMTWKIYPSNLIIWHPKKIWKNRTKHGFLLFSFFPIFSYSANVNCYIKCFITKNFFWNIHNKIIIPDFLSLFVLHFLTTDLTMKLEWEELGQRFLLFSKCRVKASMKMYCSFL